MKYWQMGSLGRMGYKGSDGLIGPLTPPPLCTFGGCLYLQEAPYLHRPVRRKSRQSSATADVLLSTVMLLELPTPPTRAVCAALMLPPPPWLLPPSRDSAILHVLSKQTVDCVVERNSGRRYREEDNLTSKCASTACTLLQILHFKYFFRR
mmetsp:Transcript_27339/g.65552  ORF Transcript_27339/g.65552 Transcript_27339/m.65552 type:complete len:151 (-) Transcript_27339:475-927(-)